MMKSIVDIDLELCRKHLVLNDDGDLIRLNGRFAGVVSGKSVWVGEKRYKTKRVRYALATCSSSFGSTTEDDSGCIVEVPDSILMMFAYVKYNKVQKTKYSGWLCRWYDADGERCSKCFDTEQEAKDYSSEMFDKHWAAKFKELNIYNKYMSLSN